MPAEAAGKGKMLGDEGDGRQLRVRFNFFTPTPWLTVDVLCYSLDLPPSLSILITGRKTEAGTSMYPLCNVRNAHHSHSHHSLPTTTGTCQPNHTLLLPLYSNHARNKSKCIVHE